MELATASISTLNQILFSKKSDNCQIFFYCFSKLTKSNLLFGRYLKKVQIGNDQEMAQSERNSHSINRGLGKKTKMTLKYLYCNERPSRATANPVGGKACSSTNGG